LHIQTRRAFAASLAAALLAAGASAAAPERKPDLADAVAGTYGGDVISDSKGESRSDVTLTLTRTGPNTVQITSSYPRLPVISVGLTAAMGKIVHRSGDSAFVYDRASRKLDVSFLSEVSWSGEKR
jgi:NADPH:quinone reductase-like Zn-dependent oxidoreductase